MKSVIAGALAVAALSLGLTAPAQAAAPTVLREEAGCPGMYSLYERETSMWSVSVTAGRGITWSAAKAQSTSVVSRGQLAEAPDPVSESCIGNLLAYEATGSTWWLGARTGVGPQKGQWRWLSSGQPVVAGWRWAPGEPKPARRGPQCLAITRGAEQTFWVALDCSARLSGYIVVGDSSPR